MPRTTTGTEWPADALQFFQGADRVPKDLLRRHKADVQGRLEARLKNKSAALESARYWKKLRPSTASAAGRAAKQAFAGLRGITDRVAKQKVAVPAPVLEMPGFLPGVYSMRLTPPYDYGNTLALGDPTDEGFGVADAAASADKVSGQMEVSVSTGGVKPSSGVTKLNLGLAQAELGVFFRPLFGPAILRVWANPSFAFYWWINAAVDDGTTAGVCALWITGYKGTKVLGDSGSGQQSTLWERDLFGIVEWDFQSNPGFPLAAQLEVDTSHFYVLGVSCECDASGGGWPGGSLAGGHLSMTLPSITLELIPILVVNPDNAAA
jgi:hypothetical protein